jgi:hypothetical protein
MCGSQTVVSQPARTSNICVANSNTYDHCGDNPFAPPPIFNKLAATGADNRAIEAAAGLDKASVLLLAGNDFRLARDSPAIGGKRQFELPTSHGGFVDQPIVGAARATLHLVKARFLDRVECSMPA